MNGSSVVRRGHMLMVAIVMFTVMGIVLATALQPLRTTQQRMLERELLYRGAHIADGIRRYYLKNGRFPSRLDDLVDQEPRFIRQLYQDPMNPEGTWELVYLGTTDGDRIKRLEALATSLSGGRSAGNRGDRSRDGGENNGPGLSTNPNSVFNVSTRQITGIRSKSSLEGLTEYEDSRIYSDWLFSALPKRQVNTGTLLRQGLQQDGQ